MVFKINIGYKGKTYKLEIEAPSLKGKKIGDSISGKEVDSRLEGYELKITGASDKQGFPVIEGVEGVGLKKVLLTKGKGLRKIKKGKKSKKPAPGLRKRKSVHANIIGDDIIQINLSVSKLGAKPLNEVLGTKKQEEQKQEETKQKENKSEEKKMVEEEKQEETKEESEEKEEKAEEQPVEEKTEEKTEEAPSEEKEETAEESEEKEEEKPAEEKKEE
jgi:small subunit ribosomal protein S6e